jgi:hypothetical protein
MNNHDKLRKIYIKISIEYNNVEKIEILKSDLDLIIII